MSHIDYFYKDFQCFYEFWSLTICSHYMLSIYGKKPLEILCPISPLGFQSRKKFTQVWQNMRVSKSFIFGWNVSLKVPLQKFSKNKLRSKILRTVSCFRVIVPVPPIMCTLLPNMNFPPFLNLLVFLPLYGRRNLHFVSINWKSSHTHSHSGFPTHWSWEIGSRESGEAMKQHSESIGLSMAGF